jgi:hypothetical protein
VTFDDQDEVRYSTIGELRVPLTKAPELTGLLRVAAEAVASYDPECEAVVLESRHEAVSVFLVREGEVVTLGTLAFVTPT